jgi:hypothetical protein
LFNAIFVYNCLVVRFLICVSFMSLTHVIYGEKSCSEDYLPLFCQIHSLFIKDKELTFKQFLASDYFNKSFEVRDMYRRIRQALPNEQNSLRGGRIIKDWQKALGHEVTLEDLEKSVRKLFELSLAFIAHEALREDTVIKQKLIQSKLRHKQLNNLLKQSVQTSRRALGRRPVGINTYAQKLELSLANYYDANTDHEKYGLSLLQDIEEQTEYLYKLAKERILLEREQLLKAGRQGNAKVRKRLKPSTVNLLQLYQLCIDMVRSPGGFEEEKFKAFEAAFLPVHDKLDPIERLMLCKYAINVLGKGRKKGEVSLERIFEWIKYRIDWTPATFVEESFNDYLNTISIATTYGDIDYANSYLEAYRFRLAGNALDAERIYKLGKVVVLFAEEQFVEAHSIILEQFKKQEDSHIGYMLWFKVLRIKLCAEMILRDVEPDTESTSPAEDDYQRALDDLRLYLARVSSQLSASYLTSADNFYRVVLKMLRFHFKSVRKSDRIEAGKQLQKEVGSSEHLLARSWLKEKINQHFSM